MADESVTQPEAAPAAPPETVAPQPEARSPFVVVKPLIAGETLLAPDGCIVSLTATQATEYAALVRPAAAIDLSRWAKAPLVI